MNGLPSNSIVRRQRVIGGSCPARSRTPAATLPCSLVPDQPFGQGVAEAHPRRSLPITHHPAPHRHPRESGGLAVLAEVKRNSRLRGNDEKCVQLRLAII